MAPQRRATRGRPRDPATDAAIFRAAIELFGQGGIERATIERVAKRARVARTTIYRRWSNREELLVQAIEHARRVSDRLGGGLEDVRPEDVLTAGLRAGVDILTRPRFRRATLRLISALPSHPLLLESFRQHQLLPRRAAFRKVLERARAQGALPASSDLDILMDVYSGVLTYRLLFHPEERNRQRLRQYLTRLYRQLGFTIRNAGRGQTKTLRDSPMSVRR